MQIIPAPEGSPFRQFCVRRLRFLSLALILCCLALLLPAEGWLMELLRQFRLWYAGAGLFAALLLVLFAEWRWVLLPLITGLWQGYPVYEYSRTPDVRMEAARSQPSFTLMSFNLLYVNSRQEQVAAMIADANPDVLLLTEFTEEWQKTFSATLWNKYPHRLEVPESGSFGICLASKLPIEGGTKSLFAGGNQVVRGTVTVGGMRVALLGVHPIPPMRPEAFPRWSESFAAYPSLLKGATGEHQILAGDFNCTPFVRTFTRLCDETGLRDSGYGFGIPSTWHPVANLPALPIDHVLVSSRLTVLERTIGPYAGSDHRWVMVKLAVGK